MENENNSYCCDFDGEKIVDESINGKNDSSCCWNSTGCCSNIKEVKLDKRQIVIDFLYLDLSVCTRCQGAENSLDSALKEVSSVLQATGTNVVINKVNVNTIELATKYKFMTSPTIRVNGRDIQMEYKESLCESCGDLCGDEVECRVWIYQGNEYTEPPKAMIIEGILKSVYGMKLFDDIKEPEYVMPENLVHFYEAIKGMR